VGVTGLLTRALRLAGASRSASAGGYRNNKMGCTGTNYGPLIKSGKEQ